MDKPDLRVIDGQGGREKLKDQLLRELLFGDKNEGAIEALKAQIDRPQPQLTIVKT